MTKYTVQSTDSIDSINQLDYISGEIFLRISKYKKLLKLILYSKTNRANDCTACLQ